MNRRERYGQFTDEELLLRLGAGETEVTEYLLDKYKALVKRQARTLYLIGGENDDLIQEGMIGLFKAIRGFRAEKEGSFYTFAELCITRQMYTAVQASRREKHAPLNSYISLYSTGNTSGMEREDWGEDAQLVNAIASHTDLNPEDMLIDKENVENLEKMLEKELSAFEKEVLDLYMIGMSYSQIAKVLGRDEKSTDNALQRMKMKIRKYINAEKCGENH